MKLHLTRKGRRVFGQDVDIIPVDWFCLSDTQKVILEALYYKRDINRVWDETALQLLIDIKMVRYS